MRVGFEFALSLFPLPSHSTPSPKMLAFTPLALLLSLSVAVSAVPLGAPRIKPTTTDVWSLVPTTSTVSKTSTSTSYSATSTAVKSPNCSAEKPYYIESST